MNRQIARLALIGLGLIAALIVGTTYWQTWATASLNDRQDNEIQRVAQFSIKRGLIRAADGTILATNVRKRIGGQTLYFRRYPQGALFGAVVGYSTQSRARSGLESSENDYLTGSNTNLKTVIDRTLDKLRGATIKGNTLWLTMRPSAQRVAMQQLNGKCGAAVAVDIRTGAVLVMATRPTYDPNLVESNFSRITNRARSAPCSPTSPLLNRATAGLFVPGSSFKVVTATAALDSGRYSIDSRFVDRGYCIEYGKEVQNFGDQNGPERFGPVSFLQALQHSINAVFCDVGKAIGARSILNAAKRYGFYKSPPLETPENERPPSGLYNHGRLFNPSRPQFQVDPGRLAFGQERMLVTPLQMAMVAAGVANHGVVMRPYVVQRVTAPDGSVISRTKPHKYRRAMKTSTAAALNEMMQAVVTGGTGTAAEIPGVRVAGKTGTAETGGPGTPNTTWFIAFAPADAPRYAVAVVLQNQTETGGTTAAPIAKEILQALLAGRSNP
ncbi:MAG TPA: penicillin-binding protein 2 [Gaiellaceae bacterium]|nr:penicillin-binding protein 2 [Gaiellaceae bacterium]